MTHENIQGGDHDKEAEPSAAEKAEPSAAEKAERKEAERKEAERKEAERSAAEEAKRNRNIQADKENLRKVFFRYVLQSCPSDFGVEDAKDGMPKMESSRARWNQMFAAERCGEICYHLPPDHQIKLREEQRDDHIELTCQQHDDQIELTEEQHDDQIDFTGEQHDDVHDIISILFGDADFGMVDGESTCSAYSTCSLTIDVSTYYKHLIRLAS